MGLVKRYARSAAGHTIVSIDVRPLPVLLDCTSRLLIHVRGCSQPPDACAAFVSDRLRAVRQDILVQQAASPALFAALVCMLRFHTAAAFFLCGSQSGIGSTVWDNVHNDQRMAEVIDLAHEVWDRLSFQFPAAAAAWAAPLKALRAELYSMQLLLAWQDPGEAKAVLAAMQREGVSNVPLATRAVLTTRLWAACHWSGLLHELDAWADEDALSADTSVAVPGSVFLRCLAQRYVPLVRSALLRTLNAAMPDRQPMPLASATSLLHFRAHPVGGASSVPAWFQCARFLTQWQLRVAAGSGGAVLSAADLRALLIDEPSDTPPPIADLVVHWNKAASVDPCSVELHARLAVASPADPASMPGLPAEGAWSSSLAAEVDYWRSAEAALPPT